MQIYNAVIVRLVVGVLFLPRIIALTNIQLSAMIPESPNFLQLQDTQKIREEETVERKSYNIISSSDVDRLLEDLPIIPGFVDKREAHKNFLFRSKMGKDLKSDRGIPKNSRGGNIQRGNISQDQQRQTFQQYPAQQSFYFKRPKQGTSIDIKNTEAYNGVPPPAEILAVPMEARRVTQTKVAPPVGPPIPDQHRFVQQGIQSNNMQGMQQSNMQGIPQNNMQGMQFSNMQGMQQNNMQGIPQNNMQGMQFSNMQEMQQNNMQGMQQNNMQGMQQNNMQGMQQNNMQGMQQNNMQGMQQNNMQGIPQNNMQGMQRQTTLPSHQWFKPPREGQAIDINGNLEGVPPPVFVETFSSLQNQRSPIENSLVNMYSIKAKNGDLTNVNNLVGGPDQHRFKGIAGDGTVSTNNDIVTQSLYGVGNGGSITDMDYNHRVQQMNLSRQMKVGQLANNSGDFELVRRQQEIQKAINWQQQHLPTSPRMKEIGFKKKIQEISHEIDKQRIITEDLKKKLESRFRAIEIQNREKQNQTKISDNEATLPKYSNFKINKVSETTPPKAESKNVDHDVKSKKNTNLSHENSKFLQVQKKTENLDDTNTGAFSFNNNLFEPLQWHDDWGV